MNRNIVLNLVFIAIFILFLVLSFVIDFFFFIPIICFLPFSFKSIKHKKTYSKEISSDSSYIEAYNKSKIKYCPRCNGEINQSNAKFCYHCGLKLNNNENVVFYG